MRFKKGDTVARTEPANFPNDTYRVRRGSVHVVKGYNREGYVILEDDSNEFGWCDKFFERASESVARDGHADASKKSFSWTDFASKEWAERWPKMDVREDFKRAAAQLMQKTSFPDISENEIAAALQLAYDDGFTGGRYG